MPNAEKVPSYQMAHSAGSIVLDIDGDTTEQVNGYQRVTRYFVEEPEVLYTLQRDPPQSADLDKWAKCLAAMAAYFGMVPQLFYLLFCFEAGRTPSSLRTGGSAEKTKTFLRTTTLLSKALDAVAQAVLPGFIKDAAGTVMMFVVNDDRFEDNTLEIDVQKAPEEDCLRAADLHIELLETFLDSFERCMSTAPVIARQLCAEIVKVANQCDGDAALMVSAFLLLRCLTPSLIVPERYNMVEALGLTDSETFPRRRARLVQFSRVLQKFANGRQFDDTSEPYKRVNAAFDRLHGRYCSAIHQFASPPPGSTADVQYHSKEDVLRHCHTLHLLLHHTHSCMHRNMAHLSPHVDVHHIVATTLARLPPPSRQLLFSLAPPAGSAAGSPAVCGSQGGRGCDTASNASSAQQSGVASMFGRALGWGAGVGSSEDEGLQHDQLLFEAHRPLGEVRQKLRRIAALRFLRVVGMSRDRVTVVQVYPSRFPSEPSPDTQHCMLLHYIKIMDGIAKTNYSLAIIGTAGAKGVCTWLKKIHDTVLPKRHLEHLQSVQVLNPCMWTKGIVGVWNPLLGGARSFFSKIHHAYSLGVLVENLKMDPRRFPVPHSTMQESNGVPSEPVCGAEMRDVLRRPDQRDRDYPTLPYQCLSWLRLHGKACRDLFSAPPVAECSLGGTEEMAYLGPQGAAALLKSYLEHLPGGLLGPQVMELCAAGADLCLPEGTGDPGKAPATARIRLALRHMPVHHLALAQDFFSFLHTVFMNSAETLLSPSALADILTRSIFPLGPNTTHPGKPPTLGEITLTKYLIAQPPAFWEGIWDVIRGLASQEDLTVPSVESHQAEEGLGAGAEEKEGEAVDAAGGGGGGGGGSGDGGADGWPEGPPRPPGIPRPVEEE